MSHKYQQTFTTPELFQKVLKDFTREVLRVQPLDIYDFGYEYFSQLAERQENGTLSEGTQISFNGAKSTDTSNSSTSDPYNSSKIPTTNTNSNGGSKNNSRGGTGNNSIGGNSDVNVALSFDQASLPHSSEELRDLLLRVFMSMDTERAGIVHVNYVPEAIRRVLGDVPKLLIMFTLSETALSAEGKIEYQPFVESIFAGLFDTWASQFFKEDMDDPETLVHGLKKDELEEEMNALMQRADSENSGKFSVATFKKILEEAELDLNAKEVATILAFTPIDKQAMVQYNKVVPTVHNLLFCLHYLEAVIQQSRHGDEEEDEDEEHGLHGEEDDEDVNQLQQSVEEMSHNGEDGEYEHPEEGEGEGEYEDEEPAEDEDQE